MNLSEFILVTLRNWFSPDPAAARFIYLFFVANKLLRSKVQGD